MDKEKHLKERLLEIKSHSGNIPEGINKYELALEMMENIGSTDSELRDDLILEILWMLIIEGALCEDQIKEILKSSLSEKHLFCRLGEVEDDSVFNRAFTVLIIYAILDYHIKNGELFLTEADLGEAFKGVIDYTRQEKDLRGYVDGKGWAHSVAHLADTLGALAKCSCIGRSQLMDILKAAREKFSNYSYVFINEEAERMTTAIVNVIARNVLSMDELTDWIKSFGCIESPAGTPNLHYWRENTKDLLRSLYFRLKYVKAPQVLLDEIEKTLNIINEGFNKRQKYA